MLIAVGSRSRNTGKTSVVCNLLGALPGRWEAVKISSHVHEAAEPWVLEEELDRAGPHDTSRYLRAGASRAWLLRAERASLTEALPALRHVLAQAGNALIESNRIVDVIRADVFLFVETPGNERSAKAGAGRYAALADAIIVVGSASIDAAGKPVLRAAPPGFMAGELADFVLRLIERGSAG